MLFVITHCYQIVLCFAAQVFHSYGNKNNEVLLQYYGFVEDINVNDYYTADLLQFAKAHGNVSAERIEEWQASPYLPALQQVRHSISSTTVICCSVCFGMHSP